MCESFADTNVSLERSLERGIAWRGRVSPYRVLRGDVGITLKEQAHGRLVPELRGQVKGRGAVDLRPRRPSQD